MSDSNPDEANPSAPTGQSYRATRERNPFAACGRTVSYLMNIPNLARLPFGQLTKLVVGQINRGHYFFVVDPSSVTCGYCGWTQATHAQADAWLEKNVEVASEHALDGPVCVINLWQASSAKANTVIIAALRTMLNPSTELVVAKRFYPNGDIRPVRLPISRSQLRPQRSSDGG
jgi:hemolysin-activating ACP:hemolysin acyltransferase